MRQAFFCLVLLLAGCAGSQSHLRLLEKDNALSVVAAVSALLFAHASSAQTPFDGSWSVLIVAKGSACTVAYAVLIQVEDGNISYVGPFNAVADGKVDNDGKLDVQLARSGDVVRATGALANQSGSGRWSTPTLQCAGAWTAHKG